MELDLPRKEAHQSKTHANYSPLSSAASYSSNIGFRNQPLVGYITYDLRMGLHLDHQKELRLLAV